MEIISKNEYHYVCEACKMYLEEPVQLPCGYTICNSHVNYNKLYYYCNLCNDKHPIPDNGFRYNFTIKKGLERNSNLGGKHKEFMKSFDSLNSILDEFRNWNNQEELVENYYNHLREQVETHENYLIEEIKRNKKCIIELIDKLEKDNLLKLYDHEKPNFDSLKQKKLPKLKLKVRSPEIDLNDLDKEYNKINRLKLKIQTKINRYKKDIFLNKSFNFLSANDLTVGQITESDMNDPITEEFGMCITKFQGHQDDITCVIPLEESNILITGAKDCTLRLWDFKSGRCTLVNKDHSDWITSVVLASKDLLISGSYDKSIRLWLLDNFKCADIIEVNSPVSCLCMLPNFQLASGSLDMSINIWCLDTLVKLQSFQAHDYLPLNYRNIETFQLKLINNYQLVSSFNQTEIKIWDIFTFRCLKRMVCHSKAIRSIEFTPDGDLLTGSNDNSIKIWNMVQYSCLKEIKMASEIVGIVQLNHDLLMISSDSNIDKLTIYDRKNKRVAKNIKSDGYFAIHMQLLDKERVLCINSNFEVEICKL